MNSHLKQRLVGAIVLVSLAVIFIPMFLDSEPRSNIPVFGSNIPPKPDYQFDTLDIPLQPPAQKPVERRVLPEPVEEPVRKAEPETAAPAPKAEPPAPPAKVPETATEKAHTGPPAWVVQVGSFGSSKNAFALRDRLRGKGFTAFVEEVGSGKGASYRVRVGPELKPEQAEALKARLAKELKLDGLVMRYP